MRNKLVICSLVLMVSTTVVFGGTFGLFDRIIESLSNGFAATFDSDLARAWEVVSWS